MNKLIHEKAKVMLVLNSYLLFPQEVYGTNALINYVSQQTEE